MTATVKQLWRHPIKGYGCESLTHAEFKPNAVMKGDRQWAIAHDANRLSENHKGWGHCANFNRGAKIHALMAIEIKREGNDNLILSHPMLKDIKVNPDHPEDAEALIAWAKCLSSVGQPIPQNLIEIGERGMTDTDYPSVSINSLDSLRTLSNLAGCELSEKRFRGNIWLEGLKPCDEFNWVGGIITIGDVSFRVIEPIKRCRATCVDPETGKISLDVLKLLRDQYEHWNFGIYAQVETAGTIKLGDNCQVKHD